MCVVAELIWLLSSQIAQVDPPIHRGSRADDHITCLFMPVHANIHASSAWGNTYLSYAQGGVQPGGSHKKQTPTHSFVKEAQNSFLIHGFLFSDCAERPNHLTLSIGVSIEITIFCSDNEATSRGWMAIIPFPWTTSWSKEKLPADRVDEWTAMKFVEAYISR
ncbi:hypothetical protein K432DRAFT_18767 [Lepidopterella palustris CBS 459.81]|uniref:Uncharacterized protein n=1 Tax=Lepidopterella palustris CBS 459.81 TaxID=1314670 RepID=A0A8E2JKA7_9PEZI|nr:hypothetical protein K432DRAFT_18767 [Lepidopterella palustris CBS 459.81]